MSIGARTYIWSVIALGLSILIACASLDPHIHNTARFLQLLVLAVLASTFKIRLPGVHGTMSLNFVIYLIGISTLTVFETVMIAAMATVAQSLWRPKTRPDGMKIAFNMSALSISASAAFYASQLIVPVETRVPALVLAATVLFTVNTWLISLVVALTSRQSPMIVWRNCNRWIFVYYVMGAGVAALVTAYSHLVGWNQALAMLPATYLMYAYCDGYIAKVREARMA